MSNFLTRLSTFGAGLVIGGIIAGMWLQGQLPIAAPDLKSFVFPDSSSASSYKNGPTTPDSGAIEVKDQPAGKNVTVASVTVSPPGVWVAVRDVNGQELGNVLGAIRVRGPQSNLEVPLLRATEPGGTYAVQLYRDDGDDKFGTDKDSVYVDYDTGERVVVFFKTTK